MHGCYHPTELLWQGYKGQCTRLSPFIILCRSPFSYTISKMDGLSYQFQYAPPTSSGSRTAAASSASPSRVVPPIVIRRPKASNAWSTVPSCFQPGGQYESDRSKWITYIQDIIDSLKESEMPDLIPTRSNSSQTSEQFAFLFDPPDEASSTRSGIFDEIETCRSMMDAHSLLNKALQGYLSDLQDDTGTKPIPTADQVQFVLDSLRKLDDLTATKAVKSVTPATPSEDFTSSLNPSPAATATAPLPRKGVIHSDENLGPEERAKRQAFHAKVARSIEDMAGLP